jgi:hypothetical protein
MPGMPFLAALASIDAVSKTPGIALIVRYGDVMPSLVSNLRHPDPPNSLEMITSRTTRAIHITFITTS